LGRLAQTNACVSGDVTNRLRVHHYRGTANAAAPAGIRYRYGIHTRFTDGYTIRYRAVAPQIGLGAGWHAELRGLTGCAQEKIACNVANGLLVDDHRCAANAAASFYIGHRHGIVTGKVHRNTIGRFAIAPQIGSGVRENAQLGGLSRANG
jgi:hypothetical protein